jgi:hypothetical protein
MEEVDAWDAEDVKSQYVLEPIGHLVALRLHLNLMCRTEPQVLLAANS